MVERIGWSMAKFTGLKDGPVYIDLRQVAAVTDAQAPGELAPLGARVILHCGVGLYTRESAGTVFEEVHRANTQKEPAPARMKMGDVAPAPVVPITPPAPISTAPIYCGEESCYTNWPPTGMEISDAEFIDGRWYCDKHKDAARARHKPAAGEEAGRATQAP